MFNPQTSDTSSPPPSKGLALVAKVSAARIAQALGGKREGGGWIAKCPAHDDPGPSLSLTETSTGKVLVHCFAGCTQEEVIAALKERGLWKSTNKEGHEAEYNYRDEQGKQLYQIVRKPGKQFSQRYPDPKGGWIWKKHPHQVLYNLPAVLKAECVLLVEGEKDANKLIVEGYTATTNAGGANAPWLPEFTSALFGKVVVLVPDNDSPGLMHVLRVARDLIGQAKAIIFRAPADGAKDISEWFASEKAERLLLDEPVEISTAADVDALEEKLRDEGKLNSKAPEAIADDEHPPFTDLGNAALFVARYRDTLRYCPPLKKFLVWDGKRWNIDEELQAQALVQDFIRKKFREVANCPRPDPDQVKHFLRSQRDSAIHAMLHLAKADLVVTPEELDTDPDLLNFKNGTLNLWSGELRPHRQEDFITKLVHHDHDPEAVCLLWEKVLRRSMGSEADAEKAEHLVHYLQVALGYSLTGRTTDKAVFFAIGPGGDNGKTTILNAFRHCIYEYATTLQAETLFNKFETSNTQADLADLRGVRFAMTSELDEGARLREGKLKRITQGMGKIKAARKYENPTVFEETHKLWVDTNHRPEIRGTDDAMWRRLHLILFNVRIPKAEQDQELTSKLHSEAEGILAWAVEGARQWYIERLQPPPEVLSARKKYREEEDQIGRFLEDVSVRDKQGESRSSDLYSLYRTWCKENGEEKACISQTLFGRRLAELGFKKRNDGHGVVYAGIRLTVPPRIYENA